MLLFEQGTWRPGIDGGCVPWPRTSASVTLGVGDGQLRVVYKFVCGCASWWSQPGQQLP